MTATQRTLIEIMPMQSCEGHGEYDPHAYYSLRDIEEMLDELGYIDCPLCLQEIVGESAT